MPYAKHSKILPLPPRAIAVSAIAAMIVACNFDAPPSTPEEALANAALRIDAIGARERALPRGPAQEQPPLPRNGNRLRFWYYSHPVIAPAFEKNDLQINGTTVDAQYIGDWHSAIQKLMVSFATDDLPDVGMVRRELVAKLFDARRIRPLDAILPANFIDDLRPEARTDYTYDGHVVALPADGYCSVLYFNKHSVGSTPPKTWPFLTAFVNAQHVVPGPQFPHGLGAYPFEEALWSSDGHIMIDNTCGLTRPESRRALHFVLNITRFTLRDEPTAFDEWVHGDLAMTVASSRFLGIAEQSGMSFGIAPVPGETGPISRRSNDAVVVFSREEGASGAALQAFLDWLTGPAVMGQKAVAKGSVPIRNSTNQFNSPYPELLKAYEAARNTPLHSEWGAIESELHLAIVEAYRAARKSTESRHTK